MVATVANAGRREDAGVLLELLRRVTGEAGQLWGEQIIGFGEQPDGTATGTPSTMLVLGFAARAQSMVLYGFLPEPGEPAGSPRRRVLAELGPHRSSVSCLSLGRFGRVNLVALERLAEASWALRPGA